MTLPLVFDPPKRGKPPTHLADLAPDERRATVAAAGLAGYRADQLSRWYFRGDGDVATLTTIPKADRAQVVDALLPALLAPVREVACDDGATRKTLWRTFDGALVESVLMRYPDRVTVCVSSQAGCGMACPFCATGQAGLTRNLSAAEIVDQVVRSDRAERMHGRGGVGAPLRGGGRGWGPGRVNNIVLMGMGEPLANYDAVVGAIRRLTERSGLNLSQRGVTLSTVGLVPAMRKFADERLAVTLAVSLHAPDDELRDTLVPVNTRWPSRRCSTRPGTTPMSPAAA